MAELLEQASQWHEVHCHDQEVNPNWVELGVRSICVPSRTWAKNKNACASFYLRAYAASLHWTF